MTARSQAVRIGLLILLGLLAISAIAGAIWVVPTMPMEWIKAGPFTDWTIPAIALGFVGVVAGAAFSLVVVEPWAGALASIATGAAIIVFEIVEIGVVGWTLSDATLSGFQKSLQLVYLVVGGLQVLLGIALWVASRRSAPPIPLIHPAAA